MNNEQWIVVSPVMSQMVRGQRLTLLQKFTFYYHHFTRTCIQATFVTTSTITLVIQIVILTQSSELCNFMCQKFLSLQFWADLQINNVLIFALKEMHLFEVNKQWNILAIIVHIVCIDWLIIRNKKYYNILSFLQLILCDVLWISVTCWQC